MSKKSYVLLFILLFFFSIQAVMATTIRETLIRNDGYDTIEPGTFIIGITKFSGNEIITAAKASIAGANDAMFYAMKNGTTKGYTAPKIYYYVDANVGWFEFDSNNNAFPVTDANTLEKLANLDIYYVSNVEKKIKVSFTPANIDVDSLVEGLEYGEDGLYVNATMLNFDINTLDGKTITFIKDDSTSEYVRDSSSCYDLDGGVIINYDSSCGGNVVIPMTIGDVTIVGIASNAFNGKNLNSVFIPSSVTSIGENAFKNNSLDKVTFDDKYDTTDFLSYSSNAFDDNTDISYNNDLTSALNSLPDSYTLKVYSGLDMSKYNTEILIRNAVIKEINTEKYNFHIDSSEIYKYYNLHYYLGGGISDGECFDHKKGSFDIFFGINANGRYSIYFQKRSDNCTRIITVDKEITLTHQRVGNVVDKLGIEMAFSNIGKVNNYYNQEVVDNSSVVTSRKYLEDFVDNNNLEYLYDARSERIVDPEEDSEIGGSLSNGDLFLFKNDILYQVVQKVSIVNVSNAYFPTMSYNDYDNSDTFVSELINSFENKTNILNYNVITLDGDKSYNEMVRGVNKVFYISMFNVDTLEYWSIYSKTLIESTYDSNNLSPESCFEFNYGIINGYNGECGADVRIPSTINGNDVTKINDWVFANYDLRSVTLPNTLEVVGNGAFYNNNLTSLTLPNSVVEVDSDAFAKNKITSLSIPNTVAMLGDGAFTSNQLNDNEAFIYARGYDSNNNVIVDNTTINSYAGKRKSSIVIPSNVLVIGGKSFNGVGISDIEIPYGITKISYYAFDDNNLTNISVPASVEVVEWGAFSNNKFKGDNCFIYVRREDGTIDNSNLVSYSVYDPLGSYSYDIDRIEIPNSVVKIWDNAFASNSTIYTDDFIIPYGVEEIGNSAFVNVYFKNPVTLPKSVSKIGMNIFSSSYSLSKNDYFVYARNEDGTVDKSYLMTYIGDGYDNGQKIVLPQGIKEIGANAFNGKYMTAIEFNNDLEIIHERAFANTYYLTSVTIPSSVKKIDDNAFNASYLTSVTLNEGIEEIGNNAFYTFNELNSISIPSTVRIVGDYAFGYVRHVKIYGKSSTSEFESDFYLDDLNDVNIEFINN